MSLSVGRMMNEFMEYLYHYTSLETLALILKNRTICFNNLLYVDDMEEAETEDMGKFGKLVYVSCWTEDAEESIPLWNLYTPNMHGVRIKMRKFPFRKYHFTKGYYYLQDDVDTYIDLEKLYNENKASIALNEPHLEQVIYTEEREKLFPKIRTESCEGALQTFMRAKDMNDLSHYSGEIEYSFRELGIYKRKNWRFQKEWRYLITISPMGLKDMNPLSLKKQQEQLRKIEDVESKPVYDRLYLEIDQNIMNEIEIVFGPKMNEAEKILAVSLLKDYCPNAIYRESVLRIK